MLTFLGSLLGPGLLAVSVSSAWHGWKEKARGPWIGSGVYACAAFALLGITGTLGTAAAAVLAFLAFAVAGGVALADDRAEAVAASVDGLPAAISWKSVLGSARGAAGAGLGYFAGDARSAWRRAAKRPRDGIPAGGAVSPEAVAEAVRTRVIPSVMEDPLLGPAPEPADLATPAVPVPAPWAALAQYIRDREPADDQELRMFSDGDTAGALAVADSYHAYADTCLNSLGLSPAYVAGVLEAGDSAAGHASLLAQVHKRFGVIYDAIKEWVGAHGPLPHKARDFLTGS